VTGCSRFLTQRERGILTTALTRKPRREASRSSLLALVGRGLFDASLYYRLNEVLLQVDRK